MPSLNSASGAGKSQFSKDVASLKSDLLNFNSGKGHKVEEPSEAQGAQESAAAGEENSIQKLLQDIIGMLQSLLSKLGGAAQPGSEGAPTEGAPAPAPVGGMEA
jgi:hypothetical protein